LAEIRCKPYNFGSKSQICYKTHNSAVNVNSLQATQFRQRITNSLQDNAISAANADSLQTTRFDNETDSLQATTFSNETNSLLTTQFNNENSFAADNTNRQRN
jgi:hypothetical protein